MSTPETLPATAASGLSHAQAAQRLAEDGPNELQHRQRHTLLRIVWSALREPMFMLLLAAGALYLLLGDLQEGLTLSGFVLVTLGMTIFQEGRTERAVDALRDLTSPRARVIREGQSQAIAGTAVVRGDVLQLHEGDRVPADALVVSTTGLQADESLLTGEAVPVTKRVAQSEELTAPDRPRQAPGGDHLPIVYAGTLIVQGEALAQVTATGARSEIGRIGTAIATIEEDTSPLQRQTLHLVRRLAWLALALSLALVLLQGLMRGNWVQALLAGIALAMSMLPQEYPMVLTIFPALGARRLAREGVLTRRITAIETLGATTVLCSDKTGTLTENRMTVSRLVAGGAALDQDLTLQSSSPHPLAEPFHALVEYAILASAVDPFDPMEQAFHHLGEQALTGTEHLHDDWQLLHTYALSPTLRAMAHVWTGALPREHVVAVKGAPEAVMDLCHLDPAARTHISQQVDTLAADGLRVLAVAHGRFEGEQWPAGEHDFDLTFIGLIGLSDPVRAAVPAAMAECRSAGIRVIMITGDYPATARAIAQQAGLAADPSGLLSGDDMASLSDAELVERLRSVTLCARIAPEQKLRIVQALKARGEIVAMTGDGVNDAPALRAAHVGIAMGGRGTDVARESAALVLVHDDFAAIVQAIRLGRRIFDNLRKAMSYILAVHVPIAGMALAPALFGWPILLYPMHIALLEIIIDPACSIAFEGEPAETDLMRRPPRNTQVPLFGGATLGLAALQGLGVLAVALGAFAWALKMWPQDEARTFAFATMVVGNLTLIVSNRSHSGSLATVLFTPNPTLWAVIAGATGVLLAALYLPWAQGLLHFARLPLNTLALAAALGVVSVSWFEVVKALGPIRPRHQHA